MSSVDSMHTAFRALAARAWSSNRARAAELQILVAEARQTDHLTAHQSDQIRAVAHRIRGSAATFGHDRASEAAEELEELLAAGERAATVTQVSALANRIDEALAAEPELDL